MRHNIFLLSILSAALCLELPDIILEMFLENVNKSADPCENFYRHACPINLPDTNTVNGKMNILFEEYEIFKNLDSDEIYKQHNRRLGESEEHRFLNEFNDLCQYDRDAASEFLSILSIHLTKVYEGCENNNCIPNLMNENCKSAGESILDTLKRLPSHTAESFTKYVDLKKGYYLLKAMKERNALEKVEGSFVELVDDLKEIALEWMHETPWLINNNITKDHEDVARSLKVKGFQEMLQDAESLFSEADSKLTECSKEFEDTSSVIPFICHLSVINSLRTSLKKLSAPHSLMNALNDHPYLEFSAPLFLISQKSKHNSSAIGSVGFITAHEISHSIMVTSEEPSGLTYFSEPAKRCINEQFNVICDEFSEVLCFPDIKLEENGADMLGWAISYEYLKRKLGDDLYKKIPGLSITHQQMYFYSAAFTMCSGQLSDGSILLTHTASNVRTNAMVQLPGFQEAFKCKDSSRMMQSRTEQCFILGKDAPLMKAHHN